MNFLYSHTFTYFIPIVSTDPGSDSVVRALGIFTRGPLVQHRSPQCIGYAELEQA